MKKIFVTGANGFLGKNLILFLKDKKVDFTEGTRALYSDFDSFNNWEEVLKGHDSIVHLAARVHVMNENNSNSLELFRATNVYGTMNLAREAKKIGIKKFIFISSIKVNGEETRQIPFSEENPPRPLDNYGISKMEAELELMKLHEKGVFEVVIIRPPLIYGVGVKANLGSLIKIVKKGIPLPFGLVKNIRSIVSVQNLCDLIIHCVENEKSGGEVFVVSDGVDYSLRDIILLIGKTHKRKALLIPVPVYLLTTALTLLGKKDYAQRLFGNLHVDISKSKRILEWEPRYTFEDAFRTKG